MLVMKTDKVTIPLYGNTATINDEVVTDPKATGQFCGRTRKIVDRELAFFYPQTVEGRRKNGFTDFWSDLVIVSVADLVEHGLFYLFEDPEAAKAAAAEEKSSETS